MTAARSLILNDSYVHSRLRLAVIFARYALALAFLSAVVDRFGVWGQMGQLGVSWGTMENFMVHVAKLNPWIPSALLPALGWFVTALEAVLGFFLIVGFQVRIAALLSTVLLLLFGLAMSMFQTIKLPLNYSVFTAAACAFLVYVLSYALHEDGRRVHGDASISRSTRTGGAAKYCPERGFGP